MNKIKEVVVVEGYHDLATLKKVYPTIDCVITNGSEISLETLNELTLLNESRGLILFLDPDYQGERIRRIINDHVGETKHAFIKKSEAINKNKTKIGIEHASKEVIEEALKNVITSYKNNKTIDLTELYQLKLIGHPNSKQRRKQLCEELGIGLSNGKTLYNKLNMFGITSNQIKKILGGD